ncbi:hypothetical protein D5086_006962 [Populus alba]|uniref:Uncharacterized protein n=1 Tax=Populus alba TaxID=43335 RepID=A0ACC4CM50_POPAL
MQMTRTDLRPDDDHCELTPSLAADIKTQKIHGSLVEWIIVIPKLNPQGLFIVRLPSSSELTLPYGMEIKANEPLFSASKKDDAYAEKQLKSTLSLRPLATKNSFSSRNGDGWTLLISSAFLLLDSSVLFSAIAASLFSLLLRITYSSGINTSINYIKG